MSTQITPKIGLETETILETETSWKTLLYNCKCHLFEDVVGQLIKATNCSRNRAGHLVSIAHHTGKATVYTGSKERCETVSKILKEIGLVTEVTK